MPGERSLKLALGVSPDAAGGRPDVLGRSQFQISTPIKTAPTSAAPIITVLFFKIATDPATAGFQHMHDPADDAAVVDPWFAAGIGWEMGSSRANCPSSSQK
jgi:hypothetical protein